MFFGPKIPEISPFNANEKLKSQNLVIIDIRDQYEIDAAKVSGSMYIPMREIPSKLAKIPRDVEVAFLCRSGNRSGQVTSFLIQHGFTNVFNIKGGIKQWKIDVDPSLMPV